MVLLLIFYSIYIFYIGGQRYTTHPQYRVGYKPKTIKPYLFRKPLAVNLLRVWFYFCGMKKTLICIFLQEPAQFRLRNHDQCARPVDVFELRVDDQDIPTVMIGENMCVRIEIRFRQRNSFDFHYFLFRGLTGVLFFGLEKLRFLLFETTLRFFFRLSAVFRFL